MLKKRLNLYPAIAVILFCILIPAGVQSKPYRGAELRTNAFMTYGRFEVRMRSGAGSGMLSSFFTFQDALSLPANWNEIDIEIMGRYTNEIQFNVITPWTVDHVQRVVLPFNPHAAFHVYAIEWTPDYIAWQVDGYEVYRQSGGHTATINLAQKLMMNIWQPTYVDWAGSFNPSDLPIYAFYDWVKYYSYTPGVNDNFTLQWSDDFDSWNTARWAKATHTFDNNNVDFITNNAVFTEGYLVLCLTMPNAIGYNGGAVEDLDVDAPYLVRAEAYPDHALLRFSEPMDPNEAQVISHYTIPGATVVSAHTMLDQKSVIVNLSGFDPYMSNNLIISGLKDQAQPAHVMGLEFSKLEPALQMPFSVNVAGDASGAAVADSIWDAGQTFGAVGGTDHDNGSVIVQGTSEPGIYQYEKRGISGYHVRLAKGIYNVILKFAETEFSTTGSRMFNVYAENNRVIDNLDILNEAGANTALEKVLSNITVDDYLLDVQFKAVSGQPVLSGIEVQRIALDLGEHPIVPKNTNLKVFPNPFNPKTNVTFELPQSGDVSLQLVDLNGKVKRVFQQNAMRAGEHQLTVSGEHLSSGVYFLVLRQNNSTLASKKIILLK